MSDRPKSYLKMRAYSHRSKSWYTVYDIDRNGTLELVHDQGEHIRVGPILFRHDFGLPGEPGVNPDPNPPKKPEDIQKGDRFWVRLKRSADYKWTIFTCESGRSGCWYMGPSCGSWACNAKMLSDKALYIPPQEGPQTTIKEAYDSIKKHLDNRPKVYEEEKMKFSVSDRVRFEGSMTTYLVSETRQVGKIQDIRLGNGPRWYGSDRFFLDKAADSIPCKEVALSTMTMKETADSENWIPKIEDQIKRKGHSAIFIVSGVYQRVTDGNWRIQLGTASTWYGAKDYELVKWADSPPHHSEPGMITPYWMGEDDYPKPFKGMLFHNTISGWHIWPPYKEAKKFTNSYRQLPGEERSPPIPEEHWRDWKEGDRYLWFDLRYSTWALTKVASEEWYNSSNKAFNERAIYVPPNAWGEEDKMEKTDYIFDDFETVKYIGHINSLREANPRIVGRRLGPVGINEYQLRPRQKGMYEVWVRESDLEKIFEPQKEIKWKFSNGDKVVFKEARDKYPRVYTVLMSYLNEDNEEECRLEERKNHKFPAKNLKLMKLTYCERCKNEFHEDKCPNCWWPVDMKPEEKPKEEKVTHPGYKIKNESNWGHTMDSLWDTKSHLIKAAGELSVAIAQMKLVNDLDQIEWIEALRNELSIVTKGVRIAIKTHESKKK